MGEDDGGRGGRGGEGARGRGAMDEIVCIIYE
jgi:hypothetical protein